MERVISARRRWLAGALLVGLGWLASPGAVPVYDGLQQPDEPYRYVAPPAGSAKTAPPTSTTTQTPLGTSGANAQALSVQTAEVGPQISVFFPQFSLLAAKGPITIVLKPEVPTAPPSGATVDGNMYTVSLTAPSGPVSLDKQYLSIATMYLRATDQKTPQPRMFYRPSAGSAWQPLGTSAGGLDIRVSNFLGPGDYLLARLPADLPKKGGGVPVVPLVLLGVLVVLGAVVLVVRLRAAGE
ncbi:MAG: hypothetical protein JWO22_1877 [Frankiales bacterium]|nr:hypothetical protein [Frankiales bacterium]